MKSYNCGAGDEEGPPATIMSALTALSCIRRFCRDARAVTARLAGGAIRSLQPWGFIRGWKPARRGHQLAGQGHDSHALGMPGKYRAEKRQIGGGQKNIATSLKNIRECARAEVMPAARADFLAGAIRLRRARPAGRHGLHVASRLPASVCCCFEGL